MEICTMQRTFIKWYVVEDKTNANKQTSSGYIATAMTQSIDA